MKKFKTFAILGSFAMAGAALAAVAFGGNKVTKGSAMEAPSSLAATDFEVGKNAGSDFAVDQGTFSTSGGWEANFAVTKTGVLDTTGRYMLSAHVTTSGWNTADSFIGFSLYGDDTNYAMMYFKFDSASTINQFCRLVKVGGVGEDKWSGFVGSSATWTANDLWNVIDLNSFGKVGDNSFSLTDGIDIAIIGERGVYRDSAGVSRLADKFVVSIASGTSYWYSPSFVMDTYTYPKGSDTASAFLESGYRVGFTNNNIGSVTYSNFKYVQEDPYIEERDVAISTEELELYAASIDGNKVSMAGGWMGNYLMLKNADTSSKHWSVSYDAHLETYNNNTPIGFVVGSGGTVEDTYINFVYKIDTANSRFWQTNCTAWPGSDASQTYFNTWSYFYGDNMAWTGNTAWNDMSCDTFINSSSKINFDNTKPLDLTFRLVAERGTFADKNSVARLADKFTLEAYLGTTIISAQGFVTDCFTNPNGGNDSPFKNTNLKVGLYHHVNDGVASPVNATISHIAFGKYVSGLDGVKLAAKEELAAYPKSANYDAAGLELVSAAITAGNSAIDECETAEAVAGALAEAKKAIDAIPFSTIESTVEHFGNPTGLSSVDAVSDKIVVGPSVFSDYAIAPEATIAPNDVFTFHAKAAQATDNGTQLGIVIAYDEDNYIELFFQWSGCGTIDGLHTRNILDGEKGGYSMCQRADWIGRRLLPVGEFFDAWSDGYGFTKDANDPNQAYNSIRKDTAVQLSSGIDFTLYRTRLVKTLYDDPQPGIDWPVLGTRLVDVYQLSFVYDGHTYFTPGICIDAFTYPSGAELVSDLYDEVPSIGFRYSGLGTLEVSDIKKNGHPVSVELSGAELEYIEETLKEQFEDVVDLDAYREEEQLLIEAKIEELIDAISGDSKTELVASYNTQAAALLEYAATLKTDAEYTAEELAAGKVLAKAELDSYVDLADYREAEQTQITSIIETAKGAIDEAETLDVVEELVALAEDAIDELHTNAEWEEIEGNELLQAIEAAKTEIKETYLSEAILDVYREAEQAQITGAVTLACAELDECETLQEVETVKGEIISDLTELLIELTTDFEYKIQEAGARLDSFVNKNLYREAQVTEIEGLIADAKEDLAKAGSEQEIAEIENACKAALRLIKTDAVLTREERLAAHDYHVDPLSKEERIIDYGTWIQDVNYPCWTVEDGKYIYGKDVIGTWKDGFMSFPSATAGSEVFSIEATFNLDDVDANEDVLIGLIAYISDYDYYWSPVIKFPAGSHTASELLNLALVDGVWVVEADYSFDGGKTFAPAADAITKEWHQCPINGLGIKDTDTIKMKSLFINDGEYFYFYVYINDELQVIWRTTEFLEGNKAEQTKMVGLMSANHTKMTVTKVNIAAWPTFTDYTAFEAAKEAALVALEAKYPLSGYAETHKATVSGILADVREEVKALVSEAKVLSTISEADEALAEVPSLFSETKATRLEVLNGITFSSETYREAELALANAALATAKSEVQAATNMTELDAATNRYEAAIAALKTKAQYELEETKARALAGFDSITTTDYREAEALIITNAVATAKAKINAATSIEAIEAACNEFTAATKDLKTKAQYEAEELRIAINAEIQVKGGELTSYVNGLDANKYTEENIAVINGLLAKFQSDSATCTSVEAVDTLTANILEQIKAVPEKPAKKGCTGSIVATSGVIAMISLVGIGLVLIRRRKHA